MSFGVLIPFGKEESFSKQHRRQYFTARVVLERVCQAELTHQEKRETTAEQTTQAAVEDSSLEWTCRLCMYATVQLSDDLNTRLLFSIKFLLVVYISQYFLLTACVYQTCRIAVAAESKPTICIVGGGPFVSRGDQV